MHLHLLTLETLKASQGASVIVGHVHTNRNIHFDENQIYFIFHEPFQKAMGKAFWTQSDVNNLSKEKESQSAIVAEEKKKTVTWFHKGLGDAIAVYEF